MPRIKGINLERIKNSTAKVIFPDLLEDIILDLDQQQIPVQELEKVKDKIINSAGGKKGRLIKNRAKPCFFINIR